jgi:hypothetical protein
MRKITSANAGAMRGARRDCQRLEDPRGDGHARHVVDEREEQAGLRALDLGRTATFARSDVTKPYQRISSTGTVMARHSSSPWT